MSTSLFSPAIKTGFWRNYDHGPVNGATLTLSARNGGYLIAFLALYVSVTGTQLWVILRFALHQFNTRRRSQTPFYAQQQLVLRNSEGTLNTAWRLFQVGWVWRRLEPHSMTRSLHYILPAILVFAAFLAGGIFSSEVSKAAGSTVVVKSNQCGVLDLGKGIDPTPAGYEAAELEDFYNTAGQILSARTYSQSCYTSNTNQSRCSVYVKQQLPWTTVANATCPFDESLCILNGTRSLQLSTGAIDSHWDLGINASPKNRVHYRKVTSCAPIHTEPFTSLRNSTFIGDNLFLIKPALNDTNWGMSGPFQDFSYGSWNDSSALEEYTYSYNIQDSYNSMGTYDINFASIPNNDPNWIPISELNRTDADIGLFFLATNSIQYTSPVDDPWFAAHRAVISMFNNTSWMGDAWVRVLACADQYQICNPNTNQCSPLDNYKSTLHNLQEIGLNDHQNQTAFIIMEAGTRTFRSGDIIISLGVDSLLATRQLLEPFPGSFPVPDNQWILEVSSWFATGLAGLQQSVVEYATGPTPDHLPNGLSPPVTPLGDPNSTVTKTICNSQMIKSTGQYQNFSVLGLCCILSIGGAIMLFSLDVESIVGLVQKKMDKGEEGRARWKADSDFHVQRMMYEGRGYVKWEGQEDVVPVYLGGDLESPIQMKDGASTLEKRVVTRQTSVDEDPETKMVSVGEITNVPSQNGTVTSAEVISVLGDEGYDDDVTSTTEATEGLREKGQSVEDEVAD